MNNNACLYNAARRLRHLRANPHYQTSNGVLSPAAAEGAASAYDWALRVLLDEFGLSSTADWAPLYHGPAGELHENQPEVSA